MLKWAIIFAVIALIAGALGFTGVAGAAAAIAKILFFVFLVVCLCSSSWASPSPNAYNRIALFGRGQGRLRSGSAS